MLKKWKESQAERDLADRKVYLVKFKFETVLGEVVEYYRWIRLDMWRSGIKRANEKELYGGTLLIGERSYNTDHIVHIDSKIIKEGYVKKSVKKDQDGYRWSDWTTWTLNGYHIGEEIEEVVEYELERKAE